MGLTFDGPRGGAGELVSHIAAAYAQRGGQNELVGAFRRSLLVVAMAGRDAVATVSDRGLRWLCAFTSVNNMAQFAAARGDGERVWGYLTVRGARLLDRPASGADPMGVAVDLASARPMLFPPVRGAVAIEAAR
jgi:hypothetical protein